MGLENMSYTEEQHSLNIKEMFFVFWQRKWLILNVVIIALTLAAIYAYRLPDTYTASAEVLLEEAQSPVTKSDTEDVAHLKFSGRYQGLHEKLLVSHPVLTEVVEQLNLQNKFAQLFSEQTGRTLKPLSLEAAIQKLKQMVEVEYSKLVYIVSATTTDPFLAATIANTLVKVYIKQYLEGRLYLSKEVMELFPEQAQSLKRHTVSEQLKDLSRDELISKLPTVQADPSVKALEQKKYHLENEINKFSQRYKDKHPKMIELRASLKFLNERLEARKGSIANSLREKIVTKFQATNVKVLREATIPKAPSGPDRTRVIVIAGLIALGGVLGLVFFLNTLDESVNSQDDIERFIRLPFLGSVHKIKKEKSQEKRTLYVLYEPMSEIAESFKHLRININFATAPEHRRTLMVTSSVPQEGKSFVAVNMAVSKAQDEKKVLLVDADLRRPKIHKLFSLENKVGLSNVLTTSTPYESVINKTPLQYLDVITSGPVSPNPPEIFSSQAMKDFLKKIEGKYETIIFDTPPAYGLPDALVLGNLIDSVIYVIQAHKTSYKLIRKTKNHLIDKGVRIVGTILNSLESSKDKSYYYDYQSYGYTYFQKKDRSKIKENPTTSK